MNNISKLALMSLGIVLTGCGGSPSFNALANDLETMVEDFEGAEQTPEELMPDSGQVDYAGVAILYDPDAGDLEGITDADLLGNVALTADFDAGTMDGEMVNFRTNTNALVAGSIDVTFATIDGNLVDGGLGGTLVIDGVDTHVEGPFSGGFGGFEAELLVGEMSVERFEGLNSVGDYIGGFYAEAVE